MENDRRTVQEVVKSLRDSAGEELAVVRCDDGSYGVTRGGRLIETLRWDDAHFDQCVDFCERFARTS